MCRTVGGLCQKALKVITVDCNNNNIPVVTDCFVSMYYSALIRRCDHEEYNDPEFDGTYDIWFAPKSSVTQMRGQHSAQHGASSRVAWFDIATSIAQRF